MNKTLWLIPIMLLVLSGAVASYLFLKKYTIEYAITPKNSSVEHKGIVSENEELFVIKLYSPENNSLKMVERKRPKRTEAPAIAEAVLEEFFKDSVNGGGTGIPKGVKTLGIYRDADQILYVDLSDELRRNFQGDVLTEYLLLKGLYKSLISNVPDIKDIKILVEGKEIETIGGHFYLKYPLKNYLMAEMKGEIGKGD